MTNNQKHQPKTKCEELNEVSQMRQEQHNKWMTSHLVWQANRTPENAETALFELTLYNIFCELEYELSAVKDEPKSTHSLT